MSQEEHEHVSDYILGELSGEARERLEGRMREDGAFRERVQRLEPLAAMLESLPDAAWETLGDLPSAAAQAPAEALATPSSPRPRARRAAPARPWRRVRRPVLVAAACALLLGAGVGIGVLIEQPGPGAGPTVVLHALAGGRPDELARARMTPTGHMVLTVEHLPVVAAGRFYELWLMNNAHDLVAVASFRVGRDGRAELNVPLPVSSGHYRYLDISLQRASAGPAHSHESVLRAAIPV